MQKRNELVLKITDTDEVSNLLKSLEDKRMEVVYTTITESGEDNQETARQYWEIKGSLARVTTSDDSINYYFVCRDGRIPEFIRTKIPDTCTPLHIADIRLYDHQYEQDFVLRDRGRAANPDKVPKSTRLTWTFIVVDENFARKQLQLGMDEFISRFTSREFASYEKGSGEYVSGIRSLPRAARLKDNLDSECYNDNEWFSFPKTTKHLARRKISLLCRDSRIRDQRFALLLP